MPGAPLRVAFLVSGEGSTLEGVAREVRAGRLPIEIVLVASDRPDAPALARAREDGLATSVFPARGPGSEGWADRLSGALEAKEAELLVLAGFLSILPAGFFARWRGRAVNLHPSLLPRHGGPGLYGPRVHRAVLASGDRESGATVHLVTEEVDRGPVLAQVRLELVEGETPDSLRARLHPHEVFLLTEILRRFADRSLPLPYPGPESGTADRPAAPPSGAGPVGGAPG